MDRPKWFNLDNLFYLVFGACIVLAALLMIIVDTGLIKCGE